MLWSPLWPLCLRENELAFLARCILGTPALQKVTVRTMQLALAVCVMNSDARDAARNGRLGAVDGPADARGWC